MTRKPSKDVRILPELQNFLKGLGKGHKFLKWINDMSLVLKENMYAGELVEKKKIPQYYIKKHQVDHLYRYEHPEFHRSCYVIYRGSCVILDIMDHDEYNKRFGYRKN